MTGVPPMIATNTSPVLQIPLSSSATVAQNQPSHTASLQPSSTSNTDTNTHTNTSAALTTTTTTATTATATATMNINVNGDGRPVRMLRSCVACRRRKVKCDGAKPSCKRCSDAHATCIYLAAPDTRRNWKFMDESSATSLVPAHSSSSSASTSAAAAAAALSAASAATSGDAMAIESKIGGSSGGSGGGDGNVGFDEDDDQLEDSSAAIIAMMSKARNGGVDQAATIEILSHRILQLESKLGRYRSTAKTQANGSSSRNTTRSAATTATTAQADADLNGVYEMRRKSGLKRRLLDMTRGADEYEMQSLGMSGIISLDDIEDNDGADNEDDAEFAANRFIYMDDSSAWDEPRHSRDKARPTGLNSGNGISSRPPSHNPVRRHLSGNSNGNISRATTNATMASINTDSDVSPNIEAYRDAFDLTPEAKADGDVGVGEGKTTRWARSGMSVPRNLSENTLGLPPNEVIEHLVDLYFERTLAYRLFIHPATFRRQLAHKAVSPAMLYAIMASSARFSDHPLVVNSSSSATAPTAAPSSSPNASTAPQPTKSSADEFFMRAKYYAARITDRPRLEDVQTMLLIAYEHMTRCEGQQAWIYKSSSISLAQNIALDRLDDAHAVRKRIFIPAEWTRLETARRVWWQVFLLETVASMGRGRRPTLCDEDFEVDLPSNDELWIIGGQDAGMASQNNHYGAPPAAALVSSTPSLTSYFVQVACHLCRVIALVNSTKIRGDTAMAQYNEVYARCTIWFENLPAHVRVTTATLRQSHVNPRVFANIALIHVIYHATMVSLSRSELLDFADDDNMRAEMVRRSHVAASAMTDLLRMISHVEPLFYESFFFLACFKSIFPHLDPLVLKQSPEAIAAARERLNVHRAIIEKGLQHVPITEFFLKDIDTVMELASTFKGSPAEFKHVMILTKRNGIGLKEALSIIEQIRKDEAAAQASMMGMSMGSKSKVDESPGRSSKANAAISTAMSATSSGGSTTTSTTTTTSVFAVPILPNTVPSLNQLATSHSVSLSTHNLFGSDANASTNLLSSMGHSAFTTLDAASLLNQLNTNGSPFGFNLPPLTPSTFGSIPSAATAAAAAAAAAAAGTAHSPPIPLPATVPPSTTGSNGGIRGLPDVFNISPFTGLDNVMSNISLPSSAVPIVSPQTHLPPAIYSQLHPTNPLYLQMALQHQPQQPQQQQPQQQQQQVTDPLSLLSTTNTINHTLGMFGTSGLVPTSTPLFPAALGTPTVTAMLSQSSTSLLQPQSHHYQHHPHQQHHLSDSGSVDGSIDGSPSCRLDENQIAQLLGASLHQPPVALSASGSSAFLTGTGTSPGAGSILQTATPPHRNLRSLLERTSAAAAAGTAAGGGGTGLPSTVEQPRQQARRSVSGSLLSSTLTSSTL